MYEAQPMVVPSFEKAVRIRTNKVYIIMNLPTLPPWIDKEKTNDIHIHNSKGDASIQLPTRP